MAVDFAGEMSCKLNKNNWFKSLCLASIDSIFMMTAQRFHFKY